MRRVIDLDQDLGGGPGIGSGGGPLDRVRGVRGFDSGGVNYYGGTGITGSVNGFWAALWFVVEATGSPANRTIARTTTPASGWRNQTGGSNANVLFGASDGGGVARTSPIQALVASDYGKLQMTVGVYDQPNALLRHYWQRLEVGAGTAFASFTPATSSNRVGDGTPNIGVCGWAGGHGVPTLAQVQAYYDQVKATRRMLAMPGVQSDYAYTFDRPANITDVISGGIYSVVGTLQQAYYAPSWGW